MGITKDHIIYGRNPVLEALDSGKDIDKILISNSIRGGFEKEIRAKSRKQRRIEAKDRRDSKNFFTVVIIATVVLLALLYLIFAGLG